ncbi:CIC11C00000002709 [Sungouiella intermedia]|uniref:CIC11C00000002709 n=1 Tax=Sungouiella intermedia TaxID=45354 RepID=A0A1L0DA06_9ASCO|nr:CIC11C00000002709 [[Candida] intermedia]
MWWLQLVLWASVLSLVLAKTHEFHFNTSLIDANPDGTYQRKVIGINGQWPLPIIRVAKNDRVIIHLTNTMSDRNASLHFHGLFMKNQNSMDGPEHVTQCPIAPGTTFIYDFVVEQTGTYWYHLHLGSQYSDGLRGMFIVEEEDITDYPFTFDEQVPLSVSDWYHKDSLKIMKLFKSRYNPTGAEPIPQNSLFNETKNVTWTVQPDTTYYLRIVNMGMFVSQYLYIEGHTFTIVEIDGVYVEPVETDTLYIAVAQRYGVLLKTKKDPKDPVFRFVNVLDQPMLDVLPDDLQVISTNYVQYGDTDAEKPAPLKNGKGLFDKLVETLVPVDDFTLRPLDKQPLLDDHDYQIVLNFTMENLGDGVNYALFNGITYTAPKVPTLYTVLSSGDLATNPAIYGSNTNTFVLLHGEVVEIVLNNMDPGLHPFHLHGHTFQVISRSEGTEDESNPQIYDEKNPDHTRFPEHPMVRDTVMVNANGFIVLRFKAENPGVWFFHCHVDWHLEQGLAITLVEAPLEIQRDQKPVDVSHLAVCAANSIPTKGNAAGRAGVSDADWLDLTGENLQVKPLPEGFTTKGYVAMLACAAAALYGIFSIYQYGMEDINSDNAEHMVAKLYLLLEKYDLAETSTMLTLDSNGEQVANVSEE